MKMLGLGRSEILTTSASVVLGVLVVVGVGVVVVVVSILRIGLSVVAGLSSSYSS